MATLRTFPGHDILGSIDKGAQEVKAYLAQAIQVLGRIPTEPEKFTVEGIHEQVERMRHDVEFFTGGPSRMVDKIKDFRDRMSRFEEARKR